MVKLNALQLTILRQLCSGATHNVNQSKHTTYMCLVRHGYANKTDEGYTGNKKGGAYLKNLDNPVHHPPAHLECCFCFAVNVNQGVCGTCKQKQNASYNTNTCGQKMTLDQHDKYDMGKILW